MVVLGSPEAMFDLLEKRSANTSDRQRVPLIELSVLHAPFNSHQYLLAPQDRDARQHLGYAIRAMVEATQACFLAALPPRGHLVLSANTTKRGTQVPEQAPEDAVEVARAYPLVRVNVILRTS